MKKTISIIFVLALGLATICLAEEGTWTKKADMPTATSLHSAKVVDGKIYVIGGTDNLYGWADYWSTVLVYDPETDTWTSRMREIFQSGSVRGIEVPHMVELRHSSDRKGRVNRENKLNLNEGTILCLLDKLPVV